MLISAGHKVRLQYQYVKFPFFQYQLIPYQPFSTTILASKREISHSTTLKGFLRGQARSLRTQGTKCVFIAQIWSSVVKKSLQKRNHHQTFDVKRQGHHRQLPIEGNGFFHPNNILREEWELPLHRPQVWHHFPHQCTRHVAGHGGFMLDSRGKSKALQSPRQPNTSGFCRGLTPGMEISSFYSLVQFQSHGLTKCRKIPCSDIPLFRPSHASHVTYTTLPRNKEMANG